MNRREMIQAGLGGAALAIAGAGAAVAQVAAGVGPLPQRDRIRVAFLLGESTNMIDTAGPWEVFQDAHDMSAGNMRMPFELFTVAPDREARQMTGGFHTRAHYSFADAPQPHVIVVPAHRGSDAARDWLRSASAGADVTMSVCTGAFKLAQAGLLEGLPVTTHHDFWDQFAREHPTIELRRGPRFVDNGRIASAGGLTSGIDLALHIVRRYLGEESAAATATYMEYASEAWRAA
jgi:transcriptional regulator GlxA family with amidase domain